MPQLDKLQIAEELLPVQIGLVLTPLDDSNLRLARQIGVTDVVIRFPGEQARDVEPIVDRVAKAGLKVSVIEGYLPMQRTVLGQPGRDDEIERIKMLLRTMAKADIRTLCYNVMSRLDATRTSFYERDRGDALVSAFDLAEHQDAPEGEPLEAETLWQNLEYFLERVLPTAEDVGVRLAMHPDDPPALARLHGQPRIMGSVEEFERLLAIDDSQSNAICFCQGCFSEMGIDVPAAIRRLGPRIAYVHFRDVVGCMPAFRETFHDCGQTDMAAAMRAYVDVGFEGTMRPDHVPLIEGESGPATGYTMLGRLFAVGYMRGLMHAIKGKDWQLA
jgi:mannonate dehydratase